MTRSQKRREAFTVLDWLEVVDQEPDAAKRREAIQKIRDAILRMAGR